MMKKTPFLIFGAAILAIVSSCGQKPQPPKTLALLPRFDTLKTVERHDNGATTLKCQLMVGTMESACEVFDVYSEDSICPKTRTAFGYDTLGNRILSIESRYDLQRRDYIHVAKREYEYDELHNPIQETVYEEIRNNWQPIRRYINEYTQASRASSQERFAFTDGQWKIDQKNYFKYDAKGNITEETSYTYNEKGDWAPAIKIQKEYSDTLTIMEATYSPARNNQWLMSSKREYSYNAKGQRVSATSYIKRNGVWTYNVRLEYTYTDLGLIKTVKTLFYDDASRQWKYQGTEKM